MDRRIWLRRPASLGRHVAVVLLAGAIVFVLAATALWLAVGSPRLPRGAAYTVSNQLELVKLALAVVAGVGGVVALVVAYRRQAVVEEENERSRAAARRDDTRLFNERFGSATTQLGHERPAARAAAVYAVSGLADDAPSQELRQICVSVLCAYLRLPYEPDPSAPGWTAGEREIRQGILGTIQAHLAPGPLPDWNGCAFNLSGAVLDGIPLPGIHLSDGTSLNLTRCRVVGGTIDLRGAQLTGGRVTLTGCALDAGARFAFEGAVASGTRFVGDPLPADVVALLSPTSGSPGSASRSA
ncbi:hypothetical protein V6V47_14450 [Micromonospora sp. CPCC 205539]|uniref:hypothetical protein n=1 Tax=Micromonospora sp. CPCC 205539 TaxID=3122408 RepID=UPI002FEF111A